MDLKDARTTTSGTNMPILRTADQYQCWRTRVTDKCWEDITLVTDELCDKAVTAIAVGDVKGDDAAK